MAASNDDGVLAAEETFFALRSAEVAPRLLGRILRHGPIALEITEVEAYGGPEDSASHARFGRTARNAPMWGPPGRLYVYLCYGIHSMLNLVTDPDGRAGAVLLRAARVLGGAEIVRERRGPRGDLLGPGKVAAALGIDGSLSGRSLADCGIEIRPGSRSGAVRCGPRVGIDYARPRDRRRRWRFALDDRGCISSPRDDLVLWRPRPIR